MKRILSTSLILAAMTVAFTGCLKDKGFENGTYGINDPDTQPPGVGFPYGSKAKVDFGLNVTTTPQTVGDYVYVNLESGVPASSDVHVTLSNNSTALVNAYNAANGTTIQVLPTAIWSVPTSLTIPAGGRGVGTVVTVTNTTALNPNIRYAVGITITAVDGGYRIADNLKNVLIVFNVKNAYDGKYTLTWTNYHPSANPGYTGSTTSVEMHTSGPDKNKIWWPAAFAAFGFGYCPPSVLSGGLSTFTLQEPEYTVNQTTNAVTVFNSYVPAASIYGMSNVFNSRYEPAIKTYFVKYGYGSGGPYPPFTAATSREWTQTMVYTGPR